MIGPIDRKFDKVVKQKPAVTKPSPVKETGVNVGSNAGDSYEQTEFSEKKKTETFTYGPKGQTYNEDGQEIDLDDKPKLDGPL